MGSRTKDAWLLVIASTGSRIYQRSRNLCAFPWQSCHLPSFPFPWELVSKLSQSCAEHFYRNDSSGIKSWWCSSSSLLASTTYHDQTISSLAQGTELRRRRESKSQPPMAKFFHWDQYQSLPGNTWQVVPKPAQDMAQEGIVLNSWPGRYRVAAGTACMALDPCYSSCQLWRR